MKSIEAQKTERIDAIITYLMLELPGAHREELHQELAGLIPDAPMNTEVSYKLIEYGCPDLLEAYFQGDPKLVEDTLGLACPLSIIMPAPGGREDTLRAIGLLNSFIYSNSQGIADASLRLATLLDDPQIIYDIADLLECRFTTPGLTLNRFAAWLTPAPAMRAWIATQMAEADPHSDDWHFFIDRALGTMHPCPIALLIKSGINPRKVCPDQAYTGDDWMVPVWEQLGSAHLFLAMQARLPSFETLCDMPGNQISALLRG